MEQQKRYVARSIETKEGFEWAVWDTQTNCWVAASQNAALDAVEELAAKYNGQDKECISLERALDIAANMLLAYDYRHPDEPQLLVGYSNSKAIDIVRAATHKYQNDNLELIKALKAIAAWPGNLPDEQYTSRTGANDAVARGLIVVAMRTIAKETLKKLNL